MNIRDYTDMYYIPSTISEKLMFAHTCTGKSIWVDSRAAIRTTEFEMAFGVHVDEYIKRR